MITEPISGVPPFGVPKMRTFVGFIGKPTLPASAVIDHGAV